jgi:plasmid stabilization system protein ParE
VRWRPAARRDLLHLARWIVRDNPDAAHRYLDAARDAADMLADLPKLGPSGRFRSRGLSRVRIWRIRGFEKILVIYAAERPVSMCFGSSTAHVTWTPLRSRARDRAWSLGGHA